MLDPAGRSDVLTTMHDLHEAGTTVIAITHNVAEAVAGDRVILLDAGRIVADGTPRNVLTRPELLAAGGLEPPLAVRAYHDLAAQGIELPFCPLTPDELVAALCQ